MGQSLGKRAKMIYVKLRGRIGNQLFIYAMARSVQCKQGKNNKIVIDEKSDVNHLKNVFRIKIGDIIRVVDGEKEYFTEIAEIESKKITVNIKSEEKDRYSNSIKIDAAIGILKNDKMDLLIQKLTEIGINKIIPVSS